MVGIDPYGLTRAECVAGCMKDFSKKKPPTAAAGMALQACLDGCIHEFPEPPGPLCRDEGDWLDCMACCIKNGGGRLAGGVGIGGIREPKPHRKPGQYPDQSWLYRPRRCLPRWCRPTLNTTRIAGRLAGRAFLCLGLYDAALDLSCAAHCSGR